MIMTKDQKEVFWGFMSTLYNCRLEDGKTVYNMVEMPCGHYWDGGSCACDDRCHHFDVRRCGKVDQS